VAADTLRYSPAVHIASAHWLGRRLRYLIAGGLVVAVSGAQATAFGGLSIAFATSVAVSFASMWLGVGPTTCVTGSAFAVLGLPVAESAPFPHPVALATGLASALVVGGLFHTWRVRGMQHAMVEALPEPVFVADTRGRCIDVNSAACRLVGRDRAELVGSRIADFVTSEDRPRLELTRQRLLSGGYECGEWRLRRGDGTVVAVEVHARIRPHGRWQAIMRDLAPLQRERAEQQQNLSAREKQREHEHLQAQKLEVVGRLASGIAHDFNNLLMGISACARATANSLPASAPARGALEEIRRAASRGSAMTRRLLSFSQQRVAERRPTDVDGVVRDSSTLCRALLGEEIELKLDLHAGGACIEADDVVLEQVLLNLLVNSRDAMTQGGHVSIATSLQRERVVVVVADDGCGMSEEVRAHAFEPFFTTKPEHCGTGLGLATVRSIVQSLDGEIDCVSEPGVGTTMRIDLPRCGAAPAAAVADAVARAPQSLQGRTVLLVEDDRLVRSMLQAHLEGCGCRVLAAEAPAPALTMAECGSRPDALVTDVSLPGMDGGELARRLRAALPGLPVVFMSAHSADHLSESGRLQRGDRLLEKPFEPETLEALLAELPARSTIGNEPATERS